MSEHTYTQAVADLFRSRPGEWLDELEIARAGGAYAWRSRVSDVRTQLGMVIENRQRKVGKRTVSEYRFLRQPRELDADVKAILYSRLSDLYL